MNVSGVIVQTRPEQVAQLRARLNALVGVEVHASRPDGRLILTVEDADARSLADNVLSVQRLPGVLAASLVYHEYDDSNEGVSP